MKNRQLLIALALVGAGTANAAGDVAIGKKKAETCMGCHAVKGYFNVYPSYKAPKVAGQNPAYIESALKAYRSGERTHETMKANAANLTDQDIADISAFFAAEAYDTPEAALPQDAKLVARGEEIANQCIACHGAAGNAPTGAFPKLAGQHPDYIINSMSSYIDGRRNNPVMTSMIQQLAEENGKFNKGDIEALAAYFSSQEGVQSLKMPTKLK